MKGINALFGKTLLALFRYWTGEGPLEGDQLFPVDARFAKDSAPMHPSRPIDCFGPADQHFLRIAAAQRASSPKGRWSIIATDWPARRTREETTCAAVPV